MEVRKATYFVLFFLSLALLFPAFALPQSQPLPRSGFYGHFQVGLNRPSDGPYPIGCILIVNVIPPVSPNLLKINWLTPNSPNNEPGNDPSSDPLVIGCRIAETQNRRNQLTPFETQLAMEHINTKRLVPTVVIADPASDFYNKNGLTIVDYAQPGVVKIRTYLTNHPIRSDILVFKDFLNNMYAAFVDGDPTGELEPCFLNILQLNVDPPLRLTSPSTLGYQINQEIPDNFFADLATEVAVSPDGVYLYVPMRFTVEVFQITPTFAHINPASILVPPWSDYIAGNIRTGMNQSFGSDESFPNVVGTTFKDDDFNYWNTSKRADAIFFSANGQNFSYLNPWGQGFGIWGTYQEVDLPNQIAPGYRNIQVIPGDQPPEGGDVLKDYPLFLLRCPSFPGFSPEDGGANGRMGYIMTVTSNITPQIDSFLQISPPLQPGAHPDLRGEPFGGIDLKENAEGGIIELYPWLLAFHALSDPYGLGNNDFLCHIECDPWLGPGAAFSGYTLSRYTLLSDYPNNQGYVHPNSLDRPLFSSEGKFISTATSYRDQGGPQPNLAGFRSYYTSRTNRGNLYFGKGNSMIADPFNHLGSAVPFPFNGNNDSRTRNVQGVYFVEDTLMAKLNDPPTPVHFINSPAVNYSNWPHYPWYSYPVLPDPENSYILPKAVDDQGPPRLTVFSGVNVFNGGDPVMFSGAVGAYGSNANNDNYAHIIFSFISNVIGASKSVDLKLQKSGHPWYLDIECIFIQTEIICF